MKLAPSILSADFARLRDQIALVEEAGAHQLHVDVMDGHYVPNLTFGPMIVEAIRRSTALPLDVHLMIENAERWIDAFSEAGADAIAVHPEAVVHLHRTVELIRKRGARPGIALNPATPVASAEDIFSHLDYVIVMSVDPGFGGQAFIPGSFDKVRRLRSFLRERGLSVEIEIDGGIDLPHLPEAARAGVDVAVAGSAIFKAADPAGKLRRMLEAVPS